MTITELNRRRHERLEYAVVTMLVISALVIGMAVAAFVQGPYSNREQELWYRYGSLGFLVAGVILPAITLYKFRRTRHVLASIVVWLAVILPGFIWYLMLSSGGV